MRTEKEIEEQIRKQAAHLRSAGDYRDGDSVDKHSYWLEALRWVLNPPPPKPPKFVCPKCGHTILKIEPASGYYEYHLDKYDGEPLATSDNFHCRDCNQIDTWYECSNCQWRADEKWREWYEQQIPGDEEEEGETEEDFPYLREKFSEESQPSQD